MVRMPRIWWGTFGLSVALVFWIGLDNLALGLVLAVGIGTNRILQMLLVSRGERFR